MRILSGSLIYDFKVAAASPSSSSSARSSDFSFDEFIVDFRYRELHATPEIESRRSFHVPRTSRQIAPIMADLLGEYEVPGGVKSDLAAHFEFYLGRLHRMRRGGGGGIPVEVTLEVKAITAGRAEAIQSRMEAGRRESENNRGRVVRRVVDTAAETMPAKKSAVDGLERWWLGFDEVEEKGECAICLERFEGGVEVMKMPCSHVYHKACIIRWLNKNHFCPFCRFKLPC